MEKDKKLKESIFKVIQEDYMGDGRCFEDYVIDMIELLNNPSNGMTIVDVVYEEGITDDEELILYIWEKWLRYGGDWLEEE